MNKVDHSNLQSSARTARLHNLCRRPVERRLRIPVPADPYGQRRRTDNPAVDDRVAEGAERLKPASERPGCVSIDERELRPARYLRRRGPHSDVEPDAANWASLQRLSHHVDLLADPPHDPSTTRTITGSATRPPLPSELPTSDRLHRDHPEDVGHHRRDAASLRLQVCRVWEMAQHPANRGQLPDMGPFDRWPTGHVFMGSWPASSEPQWEPRLYENLDAIEPPHSRRSVPGLTGRHGGSPGSGNTTGRAVPHVLGSRSRAPPAPHLSGVGPSELRVAETMAGPVQARSAPPKQLDWIPADTKLTPQPDTLASWDSIPKWSGRSSGRVIEVFAGFVERTDAQVGRCSNLASRRRRRPTSGATRRLVPKARRGASASCSPRTILRTPSSSSSGH